MEALLPEALVRLDLDLARIGVRWCLVGGMAISVLTEPRTTRDIDVVIAVADDGEAEAVIRRLTNQGYGIADVMEHRDRSRMATVRLSMPGRLGDLVADLLFASSGIEPEIAATAGHYEVIPGVFIPVATVGHMLAMKVLAWREERPQDLADIRELIRVADPEDLSQARHALDLVSRRGFDRGKDLLSELEARLRTFRKS